MRKLIYILTAALLSTTLSACYNGNKSDDSDSCTIHDSLAVCDTMQPYPPRHYGIGYNFIVHSDSIMLIEQQPEEHISLLVTDTFNIRHERI